MEVDRVRDKTCWDCVQDDMKFWSVLYRNDAQVWNKWKKLTNRVAKIANEMTNKTVCVCNMHY